MYPQLETTDEGPEQAHHAQELDSAQVLHRVLLAHVGYSVENGAEQDQAIAQHHVIGCKDHMQSSNQLSGKRPASQSQLYTHTLHRRKRLKSILTGSLVSFSQNVGADHRPHPQQTHQHGSEVDRPVASLQEEPGQNHQHRDHEAVQQLKRTRRGKNTFQ